MMLIQLTSSFVVIALASYLIGKVFSHIKLPYITGYLFAGALAGPFLLNLLPTSAVEQLRFIDELSLAIIAFVAGGELNLKELRKRLNSILLNTAGIAVSALLLSGIAIFLLTSLIPFTQDMPLAMRAVVAILGSTVLLALSPPSTIAVIQEVRARGPFTRTTLSITVFMDVVIIVLFAVSTSVASAILTGMGLDFTFVLLLAIDLSLALVCGYLVGQLLRFALGLGIPRWTKIGLVLLIGYGIYFVAGQVKLLSAANLPFEIYIEPLLIAMLGGFIITNFTTLRDEFEGILHELGPFVYVAFFTLTGVSLKLDILLTTLPIALALFLVRALGIYIGSYIGGTLAKEPKATRQIAWMGLITQAGIALGLAREVAVQFPALGDAFATLIISVIVLNEVFGPMLLKEALKRAGEARLPGQAQPDEARDALVLGIEEQSLALARQLKANNWEVIMADTDAEHVERLAAEDVTEIHIPAIDEYSMHTLMTERTDAVVALLDDDQANLRACEIAYEKFGIRRLIVRLKDRSLQPAFDALGAFVVDPAIAMVHLLDQSVRAPNSAELLLHRNPDFTIGQVTVTNPDIHNLLVRDIRLPNDVLLLDIRRNGHSLVPDGYTRLHLEDEVTVLCKSGSLDVVTLKLGF